jgi:regulatory associated protein of mTOR
MIRLYRNYDPATSSTDVQMVSAFRGLSEIISMRRGAGVIVDWKQAGGFLLVGGDSRIIRVWDAHTEAQLLVRVYFDLICDSKPFTEHSAGFGNQL